MTEKCFITREWILRHLQNCISDFESDKCQGILLFGDTGSGKTAFLHQFSQAVANNTFRNIFRNEYFVISYFCRGCIPTINHCLHFIFDIYDQLIKFISKFSDQLDFLDLLPFGTGLQKYEGVSQDHLESSLVNLLHHIAAILGTSRSPNTRRLLFILDGIDTCQSLCYHTTTSHESVCSCYEQMLHTVARFLGAASHFCFPLISLRTVSRSKTNLFPSFKQISLSEWRWVKAACDIQQYILHRLTFASSQRPDHNLNKTHELAACLNRLYLKSGGCFLYVQIVMDIILDGPFHSLIGDCIWDDLENIPITLNGLYLWICNRVFAKRRYFYKVRLVLNILLACERQCLTVEDLFSCICISNIAVTHNDFYRRLQVLGCLLLLRSGHDNVFFPKTAYTLTIFHHTFAEFLCDIKHCTSIYLCDPSYGHSALAVHLLRRITLLDDSNVCQLVIHLLNSYFNYSHNQLALLLLMSGVSLTICLRLRSYSLSSGISAIMSLISIDDAFIINEFPHIVSLNNRSADNSNVDHESLRHQKSSYIDKIRNYYLNSHPIRNRMFTSGTVFKKRIFRTRPHSDSRLCYTFTEGVFNGSHRISSNHFSCLRKEVCFQHFNTIPQYEPAVVTVFKSFQNLINSDNQTMDVNSRHSCQIHRSSMIRNSDSAISSSEHNSSISLFFLNPCRINGSSSLEGIHGLQGALYRNGFSSNSLFRLFDSRNICISLHSLTKNNVERLREVCSENDVLNLLQCYNYNQFHINACAQNLCNDYVCLQPYSDDREISRVKNDVDMSHIVTATSESSNESSHSVFPELVADNIRLQTASEPDDMRGTFPLEEVDASLDVVDYNDAHDTEVTTCMDVYSLEFDTYSMSYDFTNNLLPGRSERHDNRLSTLDMSAQYDVSGTCCHADSVSANRRVYSEHHHSARHQCNSSHSQAHQHNPMLATDVQCTRLHEACWLSDYALVHTLIRANPGDALVLDNHGRSPFIIAVFIGNLSVVKLLYHVLGVDANAADYQGVTPLIISAYQNHREVCEFLLHTCHVDVDHRDQTGRSALFAACSRSNHSIVQLLLHHGCYPNHLDSVGRTCLSVAALHCHPAIVECLLAHGLDESHRDNAGLSPLHYAVMLSDQRATSADWEHRCVTIVNVLLRAGADVNVVDNEGRHALILASHHGLSSAVELLLRRGASVDLRAQCVYSTLCRSVQTTPCHVAVHGESALSTAVHMGHISCALSLLKAGADPCQLDACGVSLISVARSQGNLQMVQVLGNFRAHQTRHGIPEMMSRRMSLDKNERCLSNHRDMYDSRTKRPNLLSSVSRKIRPTRHKSTVSRYPLLIYAQPHDSKVHNVWNQKPPSLLPNCVNRSCMKSTQSRVLSRNCTSHMKSSDITAGVNDSSQCTHNISRLRSLIPVFRHKETPL